MNQPSGGQLPGYPPAPEQDPQYPTSAIVPAGSSALAAGPFSHRGYVIKRPFLTLLGRSFRIEDSSGNLVLFVRHKLLAIKDQWSIYADESMTTPLLNIAARKALTLKPIWDVTDARSGDVV